jgi:ribosomal protein L18
MYAQVIDDVAGRTLASASTLSKAVKAELGEEKTSADKARP